MKREEIRNSSDICIYCPWTKGEIDHLCDGLCEGLYCDEAVDNFCEENRIELED